MLRVLDFFCLRCNLRNIWTIASLLCPSEMLKLLYPLIFFCLVAELAVVFGLVKKSIILSTG